MESWAVAQAAIAPIFESEINSDSPFFGDMLLYTYMFLQARTTERARTPNALVDSIQRDQRLYILCAIVLSLCYVNRITMHLFLFVSVVVVVLYLFMNHVTLTSLQDDIKWIRRELQLLRAIRDDAAGLMNLGAEIENKAHEVWDSVFDFHQATVGLFQNEEVPVEKIKDVVQEAEDLIRAFEELGTSGFRSMSFSILNFARMDYVYNKTKVVKNEINQIILLTIAGKFQTCEALEKSWSKIRKLLDRPLEEHKNKWVKARWEAGAGELISSSLSRVNRIVGSISVLKAQFPPQQIQFIELQIVLLNIFLNRIEGLRLETEIERAWLNGVDEILGELELAIDSFLKRQTYPFRWLSDVNTWKARRKLKADIRYVETGFNDHFERKKIYGFGFIRRDSSKSILESLYQTMGDTDTSQVVDGIQRYLDREPEKLVGVSSKITSLCDELKNLGTFLEITKATEGRDDPSVVLLQEIISEIATQAGNSIKTFHDISALDGTNHSFGITMSRLQLSREIDRIAHRIHLLDRSIKAYNIESRDAFSSVVGLEEDIHAMVSQLTMDNEDCSVFSIVGTEGIGKTTLAKKVYGHRTVMAHFQVRAWVTVLQRNSDDDQFLDVVMEVPGVVLDNTRDLKEFWSEMVRGKRYLLVLDNVPTKEDWNSLKATFLQRSIGSRILVTTRNKDFVSEPDQASAIHHLRLRTKDESLMLLSQMLHISPGEETKAKEIVDKSLGLPLAILHVGYLALEDAATVSGVLEHINHSNDERWLRTSHITNKELPQHLRECLYYFGVFPVEFEVPARRVIALWVAEGLVQITGKDARTREEVAYKYLSELIEDGFVRLLTRKRNGKVKTCCLPIALREFWLDRLRQEGVSSAQRLADHFDENDEIFGLIHGDSSTIQNDMRNYTDIHSFLSFDPREGNEPGEDVGNFLRGGIGRGYFQKLQVLDLEHVFRPELPNTVGKLKKLKYLGLRWTYLERIPSSIGDLVNLETLDLKHTYVRVLPSSVWKLQRLRILYLNQTYRTRFMHQPIGSSLKNLETLWGVFLDKDSPLKDSLDKLINLRKLGLAFQLDVAEQEELAYRISKLKKLQSLRLRSVDDMGKPRELFLKLSTLENLSSLDLFGRLKKLSFAELPENLSELTLSSTRLPDKSIRLLEELPRLKILCFYSDSYAGKRMVFSHEGFPQLTVLKIWKLEELEEWIVHEKALPSLRDLEIRSCEKLKVPDGLKNLKTLLELKLTNMPEEFVRKFRHGKGRVWDDNCPFSIHQCP